MLCHSLIYKISYFIIINTNILQLQIIIDDITAMNKKWYYSIHTLYSTCVRFSRSFFSAFIVSIWSRRSLILLSISSKRCCKHKVLFHINKTQNIRFTDKLLYSNIYIILITIKYQIHVYNVRNKLSRGTKK